MSTDEPTKTIWPYCGVGCGIAVRQGEEPDDVRFAPWGDAPVNEGRVCIKTTKEGVVWTTPHFAAAPGNALTNDVLDERAKIPEYKATAVDVTVADGDRDTPADD